MNIRPIAIYLPQFHPIYENDQWWGKGFTEWTNVAKAQALFEGHYQPHLPSDLGFYDLRIPEVREEQVKLAKEYNISGFCYYHYWFNGRRILERPFAEVFESGKPDFPFMLCWANENWTRVWDGGDKQVLLEQHYNFEDDLKHIQTLIPYFKDDRYIRIDNKPVVAIYRSTLLPDIEQTIQIWRNEAAKHKMELYICRFESFGICGKEYLNAGFDAAIETQPLGNSLQLYNRALLKERESRTDFKLKRIFYKKIIGKISNEPFKNFKERVRKKTITNFVDYEAYSKFLKKLPAIDYKRYPTVTPMWDNSARRKINPVVFFNSSPSSYREWLKDTVEKFKPYSKEENLLFLNAWNEWGEGNHLEPCSKWGHAYLQTTKEVLENFTI